ncbi:MAG: hypothetical protein A3G52_03450 [Candidatus Taylorbacteria bacterium RIFCSPLOWO2_12_FULL_43_20]|uniref:Erythromycin biosynthesis sensory transduction protein eryC1 n=1 Tax=Candidatus Taylorbacteria bacterium RIFCSPLOWO2_12_FULL_43_20 TaxID=1802332 RepID=A0A1G2P0J7_9BACT|nr:MAG: hypothetical protein A2825_02395 [Candidatus Taylorbacteria bacterium RIFCSPHIGHO2_01_FULL_43_120]OHA22403.1 MAG: hypothetical protein A3B98_02295 [Candidatus Taylorbacteria bacterium RIFCSPHIGHO2_02_FULL_43_55]OHA28342.1 MAG: hypothetical protein A3E92_00465 [Candidatus Taylorbacteria bacterium RIFCSPHIGHO2_12_FULL_42_34]OHA30616.1 MAG: hypothetical protein A3B09_00345 [Candidatus Taylorbacteria bacterium RIFCSPLOWO2_01_FULL_43_83]OHA38513.1 MAG: hypothetical protein A3H58_02990 [Candi
MKIPFLDLKAQYKSVKKEVETAIAKVFESGVFVMGPKVEEFEKSFSIFLKAEETVAVSSGTDAIHIALRTLNIGAGDEVITTAHTFFATVGAILLVGAKPVFVDIEENTHQINVADISKKITPKTKAIIPVHLYGQACDMDAVVEIAKKNGLFVIEDACQAHGSEYKRRKCGTIGDIGCFSFYPGKNLGTYGEGGALVTDNPNYAHKARMIRNHGSKEKYRHDILGGNFRMSAIEGAVLGAKMKHLPKWNKERIKKAGLYNKHLSGVKDIFLTVEPNFSKGNYHLYVIRTKYRDKLAKFLKEKGVETGIHYPVPAHLHKSVEFIGMRRGDFPIAEKVTDEIISLPMYPELKESEIRYISECVKKFFKRGKL